MFNIFCAHRFNGTNLINLSTVSEEKHNKHFQ